MIKEKAKGKIAGRFAPFPLLREDINGKVQVSYMNLASMKFRTNLIHQFYSNYGSLSEKLKGICSTLSCHIDDTEVSMTDKQKEIERKEKELQKKYKQDDRLSCLVEIEKIYESDKLTLQLLNQRSKQGNNIQRKTYKEMALLYNYMDTKELIRLMKELKSDNSIAFKNLNNAVMYWALAEEHPFKKAIRESFSVNQTLSSPEIQAILVPIVKYHLHKVLMPRKYISLFKSMYKTDRPRNQYVIRGENPLQLKEHKDRIAPEENNLLRFFNF